MAVVQLFGALFRFRPYFLLDLVAVKWMMCRGVAVFVFDYWESKNQEGTGLSLLVAAGGRRMIFS